MGIIRQAPGARCGIGGASCFCYPLSMNSGRNVFLIGPRASGKTSVGRILAERLGFGLADTDEIAVRLMGESIAAFVEKNGWPAFRNMETRALAEAAGPGKRVIATGGGIVLAEENRAVLKAGGLVVYLRADPETLAARLKADPDEAKRPALTAGGLIGEVASVLAEREPLYLACADHVVESAGGARATADKVLRLIEQKDGS